MKYLTSFKNFETQITPSEDDIFQLVLISPAGTLSLLSVINTGFAESRF